MLEDVDRTLEWTGSISQWIFEDRQDHSNSWPYLLVARLSWISTFPLVQRRYHNICVIGLWRITEEMAWLGKIPWWGHGNPLQYSCLENAMDRGAWQDTVHRDAKSQTQLSDWYTHTHTHNLWYWWTYLQSCSGDTDIENTILDTVWKGEGETNCENSMETCILPHVK